MLGDLVLTSDANVNSAFAYKCWNICRRKEDQRYWQILNESNI